MFGRKKARKHRIKVSSFGPVEFGLMNHIFEMDLTREATITITANVIDCDNGGTCETSAPGGFRIELIPL